MWLLLLKVHMAITASLLAQLIQLSIMIGNRKSIKLLLKLVIITL